MTAFLSDRQSLHIVPHTIRLIEEGIESGLHLGAQMYVSKAGETLVDVAIGEASEGVPLASDDLMLWLSSGKPLTASAILRLYDCGTLDLADTVATYVPEFADGGKVGINIWNCLTHTGGFRHVESGWPETPWDAIIDLICRTPIESDWVPSHRAGYHVASSWFVLAEIIHRLTGISIDRVVREDVCLPIGMHNTFSGMTRDEYHDLRPRIVPIYNTWRGRKIELPLHDEDHCTSPAPGGNNRGTARDMGRFYEQLLADAASPDGGRLLQPRTAFLMRQRQREGLMDETFQQIIDAGLGVLLDSKQYGQTVVPYGFGKHSSAETFGHGGNQSSIGFADPESQLVVSIITNGMPGEPRHNQRNWDLTSTVYEDLRE